MDVFLRINGWQITGDSKAIYETMMKFLSDRTFDMEQLVPWLENIVERRPQTRSISTV